MLSNLFPTNIICLGKCDDSEYAITFDTSIGPLGGSVYGNGITFDLIVSNCKWIDQNHPDCKSHSHNVSKWTQECTCNLMGTKVSLTVNLWSKTATLWGSYQESDWESDLTLNSRYNCPPIQFNEDKYFFIEYGVYTNRLLWTPDTLEEIVQVKAIKIQKGFTKPALARC